MPPKLDGTGRKLSKPGQLKRLGRKQVSDSNGSNELADALPVARFELLERIDQFSSHLIALLKGPCIDLNPSPLEQKSTDDLTRLLEFGWLTSEIATIWGIDPGQLACWISADTQRSASAQLARKVQAEIWDRMAFAIGLLAPNDRVEMTRARLLMDHCKWRASMYNPDAYVRRLTVNKTAENKGGRMLTTEELRTIAGGDLPASC